jgi:hypothetical protein
MTVFIYDSIAAPNHENARPTKSIEESSGETVDESASVSPAARSGDVASVTDDPGERKPRIASGAVSATTQAPIRKDLREAIAAYVNVVNPRDPRPGFAKVYEIAKVASTKELVAKPELWPCVITEVKRLTAEAMAQQPQQPHGRKSSPHKTAPPPSYELITVCGSDVKVERLKFFWPGVMPLGYLFLVGGDPGLNKSTLTVDTAARASRGDFWPCSTERAPISNSLFITMEDGVSDVIMPRYLEAGGDPSRVFFAKGKIDTDGKESGIDLRPECLPAIEKAIQRHNATLVVIDPVSAYLAGIDSHNDAEVRAMLMPVQEIAARNKCVIELVLHFNKDASKSGLHRFMASVAFVAVCRAAFGVVKDKNDPKKRLFLPIKANLAPDTHGFQFHVQDSNGHPRITWGADFSAVTIDEALMPEDHQSKKDRAMLVIQTALAEHGGEMERDTLFALTQSKKIGSSATYAALKELGLKSRPSGVGGKWAYAMPKTEIGTDEDFDRPEIVPAAEAPKLTEDQEAAVRDLNRMLSTDDPAAPQPTPEELRSFDEPPAGNTVSSAEPAPSSTPIAPALQPAAKANSANGKTDEQLLMEQLGARLEDAAKLLEGKFTTPEKVARASEAALVGCGIHRVYAKTLQKAAHTWLRRAAQMRRTAHVI